MEQRLTIEAVRECLDDVQAARNETESEWTKIQTLVRAAEILFELGNRRALVDEDRLLAAAAFEERALHLLQDAADLEYELMGNCEAVGKVLERFGPESEDVEGSDATEA